MAARPYLRRLLLALVAAAPARAQSATADLPPPIPIGEDAFLQWRRWAQLRLGVRAFMKSTFDRSGGNHFADSSHFLRQSAGADREGRAATLNVALDEAGPGILWFVRHNHWHGSPWHYRVDGRETIVTESSSADPTHPVEHSVFEPRAAFPPGLTWTWSTTRGADLSWVPIGFERSLELDYERACYGTGYFIFWRVMRDAPLTRPLSSWSERCVPSSEVLDLLARVGTDVTLDSDEQLGSLRDARALERDGLSVRLERAELAPLGRFAIGCEGPATSCRLLFRVPAGRADAFALARLKITWDERSSPSIDAPIGLFFGTGALPDDGLGKGGWLVRSFPTSVRGDGASWIFATRFPMPFEKSARLELEETQGAAIPSIEIQWLTKRAEDGASLAFELPFHATYRDFPAPEPGIDLVLLDTREVEGGGPFCGHFVGTTYLFTHDGNLGTLEGDPRFFFDDSNTPQAQGTGSEEWGGGGDYWGGRTMTLPFAGHPVGKPPGEQKTAKDRIHSAYRFLLSDLMPFGRNARITLEHGADSLSREHYETVTYWYGLESPGLVLTDELDVGGAASEKLHTYMSPDATAPETVESRFELGVDHVTPPGGGTREVFPTIRDDGRRTRTFSEFTLELEPDNQGVLLRRRLDLRYPDQRARVLVAAARPKATSSEDGKIDWLDAGTWYTAGGDTCVFADPRALPASERKVDPELAPAACILETSNRRFREDEFLIARALTRGRSSIRVRIEFEPNGSPLHPGAPPPDEAWTEFRYFAYCFVLPRRAR